MSTASEILARITDGFPLQQTITAPLAIPTTPGTRYAVSFISLGGSVCNLLYRDPVSDKNVGFTLADGSTTSASGLEEGDGNGWEIVAPTNEIRIFVSGSIRVFVTPIA
jgi:hypothetical protein